MGATVDQQQLQCDAERKLGEPEGKAAAPSRAVSPPSSNDVSSDEDEARLTAGKGTVTRGAAKPAAERAAAEAATLVASAATIGAARWVVAAACLAAALASDTASRRSTSYSHPGLM